MADEPPVVPSQMPIVISVATVTFNAAAHLANTIASVEAQTYPYIEHIVVDGNSTDNTLHTLHEYQKRNSLRDTPIRLNALSEPDEGIYDAMNKALRMAKGDYIVFMNAGDSFHHAEVLAEVVARAEASRAATGEWPAVLYGLTHLVDHAGHFLRPRHLTPPVAGLHWQDYKRGMLVCHQAFFAFTEWAKTMPYDRRYRLSADYDWCVRLLRRAAKEKRAITNSGTVVANYLYEGATTRHHWRSLRERFAIMRRYYGLWSTLWRHVGFLFR